MAIALIVAAGQGRRMQHAVAKQYLELDGVPILARTLSVFHNHPLIERIVAVVPPADMDYCRQRILPSAHRLTTPVLLVAGGATRQESVYHGLRAAQADPDDIVVIHDGVRPFLTAALLTAAIELASERGACLLAIPLMDTPKHVGEGDVVETTLLRDGIWLAQTPQVFRAATIRNAHEKARREGYVGTDDAQLVERAGCEVRVVRGTALNIKITTADDLLLAKAIASLARPAASVSTQV